MTRWMEPFRWLAGCALVIGFSAAGGMAQTGTLVGRVVEDEAEVRAGAGTSYYLVGKLKKDTVVNIEDRFFEWFKISPTAGIYSYVKKNRVDKLAEGSRGVINTDRTDIRAASIDGAGESYRRQVDLNKGDEVEIISEEGDYYKIKPPRQAYVFVRVSSVRREELMPAAEVPAAVGAVEPAAPAATETIEKPAPAMSDSAAEKPASTADVPAGFEKPVAVAEIPAKVESTEPVPTIKPDTPAVAVAPATVKTPVIPARPVASDPKLADLEKKFQTAQALPLEQQPIGEMLNAYQSIYDQTTLSPQEHRTVLMRIVRLKRNAQLAQTLREISLVQQSLQDAPTPAPTPQQQRTEYDAVGQLVASGVYDGINLPRLFRLVSPSLRTVAYVRPSAGVDAATMLGRIVGIIGESRYDPALKLSVLEAGKIEVLKADSTGAAGTLGAVPQ